MADTDLMARIDRSITVAAGMATAYVLDAAREVAVAAGRPLMVIASRRQVDNMDGAGGYVGWTTPQWCAQGRAADGGGSLLLCRDHGGPYQHPRDAHRGPRAAMESALASLRSDIESGLELLHLDTSLGAAGTAECVQVAQQRAVELAAACAAMARDAGRPVAFEVGIEVQSEDMAHAEACRSQIGGLLGELRKQCGITPAFVVAQTGTKVTGRYNSGVLQRRGGSAEDQRRLCDLAAVVRAHGARLKAHNCDYLSVDALRPMRRAGAWMNVSPELGCAQTIAVVRAAREARLHRVLDDFCGAAVAAGYWRKWVSSLRGPVPDQEKVVLGGSYLFATPAFTELRVRLDHAGRRDGRSTRRIATDAAKTVISRYLPNPLRV